MSTFTQHNKGANSKGVQVFDSKDSSKFKQYGGGIQIIDGVAKETSNSVPSQNQTMIVNGGFGFQATNMTTHYHK